MGPDDDQPRERLDQLAATPDLAAALESDAFKQFLDHMPIAIAVAELDRKERIVYVNFEFERLTGRGAGDVEGKTWGVLAGHATGADDDRELKEAITEDQDYIGSFAIERGETTVAVDAWSNLVEDEAGAPVFRLIALAEGRQVDGDGDAELLQKLREKDVLLRELQHRVRNNLQMITALIRHEARNMPEGADSKGFDRLAGRVESLALLYRSLSEDGAAETIDLGIYLSQIASAVMRAHATEGIRLDLKVDTWPVSINVAMPAGLVVNELLTNALKYAFEGRDGGTITLHSLVSEEGCRVLVADDGVGLAEGVVWPKQGKLGAMIVASLRHNARARVEVESKPGAGMRVTIVFERAAASEGESD